MKYLLVFIIVFLILARLNLPPSEDINNFLEKDADINIIEELSLSILFSQAIADWTYRDYIFVKFACSRKLKLELIAVPFKKWDVYKKNIANC